MLVQFTTITDEVVVAPVAGVVGRLLVDEGDVVSPGQGLCVLEALKLETIVRASSTGRVHPLVAAEELVRGGQPLFSVKG